MEQRKPLNECTDLHDLWLWLRYHDYTACMSDDIRVWQRSNDEWRNIKHRAECLIQDGAFTKDEWEDLVESISDYGWGRSKELPARPEPNK